MKVNIQINEDSKVSVYSQITRQFMLLVLCDALQELNKVPSVRELAAELGIATGTVSKSYSELIENDVLYSRKGRGVFVKEGAYESAREVMEKHIQDSYKLLVREAQAGGFELSVTFNDVWSTLDFEAPIYGGKYNG